MLRHTWVGGLAVEFHIVLLSSAARCVKEELRKEGVRLREKRCLFQGAAGGKASGDAA
jgi:hypothetical protein